LKKANSVDQEIKIFMDFGLTKNQAKIYRALTRLGALNAKEISQSSKIAREQVYRIYPELMDLGLIKTIIESPISFEALPIEEGISLLIKRKMQQINYLNKEAIRLAEIAKKSKKKKDVAKFQNNGLEFKIIPKRDILIKKIKQSINSAQESFSVITSIKRHPHALFVFKEEVKSALSRGVKFKVIVEDVKNDLPEIAKKFEEHPLTSVKYISSSPRAVVVLIDNRKAFFIISPTSELESSHALQIKNLSLVRVLQKYFEYLEYNNK